MEASTADTIKTNSTLSQLFSIIAHSLRNSEVKTREELIKLISDAPIDPQPDVKYLHYTYDWRSFISQNFSPQKLKYHSYYHRWDLKVVFFAAQLALGKWYSPIRWELTPFLPLTHPDPLGRKF